MSAAATCLARQRGFTLIEALVALVILVIGLLGIAALQMHLKQYQMESYQRAQALVLLEDMVNRINANRYAAPCYAFTTDTTNGTPYVGTGSTYQPACSVGTINQQNRATQDVTQWAKLLQGASETDASNNQQVGAMVGARGCVYHDTTNHVYVVTVVWQGMSPTAPPPSALTCAYLTYDSKDRERRAVSATVKLGTLS